MEEYLNLSPDSAHLLSKQDHGNSSGAVVEENKDREKHRKDGRGGRWAEGRKEKKSENGKV